MVHLDVKFLLVLQTLSIFNLKDQNSFSELKFPERPFPGTAEEKQAPKHRLALEENW